MTVAQGARPMAVGAGRLIPNSLPGGAVRPAAGSRRKLSNPTRSRGRANPFGKLLAVVLVSLLIGLIYVAQTIQLAATGYEVDRLGTQREDIARQVRTVETNVLRWGTEATVLERAQRIGLDQLATRIRLPAH